MRDPFKRLRQNLSQRPSRPVVNGWRVGLPGTEFQVKRSGFHMSGWGEIRTTPLHRANGEQAVGWSPVEQPDSNWCRPSMRSWIRRWSRIRCAPRLTYRPAQGARALPVCCWHTAYFDHMPLTPNSASWIEKNFHPKLTNSNAILFWQGGRINGGDLGRVPAERSFYLNNFFKVSGDSIISPYGGQPLKLGINFRSRRCSSGRRP